VPALLIKYRELSKLKNTYIDVLPTYINPKTGRIHTTFSQTSVATGRLASSDPNLQNIPADSSDYGLHIRSAFKAQSGRVFIAADYSQIELRVLAYLSGDEQLTAAFLHDKDIHTQTAAHLFDLALSEVEHHHRQIGKRINFSILYGLTPYGLSKDLGISFKDAKKYIEKYFAQYPGVSLWMEQIVAFAKEHGYVKTVFGRRRYIAAIHEKNKALYEEACRVAINTVAQGTAADIMKKGMLNLEMALRTHELDAQMVLQIHDELIISVAHAQQQQAERVVRDTLETVVQWPIPLRVTTRIGNDWAQVTK
jgi:DNA polymerase-1